MVASAHFRRTCILLALALPLAACSLVPERGDDPARIVRGPLSTRIQHPLALNFLELRARRPVTQPEGTQTLAFSSAYTSVYARNAVHGNEIAIDGELWRNELRVRHGLDERTDIELECAALFASHGFLDHFLDQLHDAFELPDQGRSESAEDLYDMSVRAGADTIYELDPDEIEFQDLPLILTHRIGSEHASEGAWTFAWSAGVEFPTGSASGGGGNGELDFGAGFLGERSDGRWTQSFAVNAVRTGESELFERADVQADDLFELRYGLEMRWTDDTSLLALLSALSPVASDLGLRELEQPIVDLGLGIARDISARSRWFVSFHEDLAARSGVDFTLYAGWSYSP